MLNLARNQAIDKTRSKEISYLKKTSDIDNLVSMVESREVSEIPIETIGIASVLDKLNEDQKFVVTYIYLKGYTHSELAEEFNIPLGTVKTRLRMAMIELRRELRIT